MSAFTQHVFIEPSGNPNRPWRVTEPLSWDLLYKGSGFTITVEAGYLSDLVTMPWLARLLIDVDAIEVKRAAVFHDWLIDNLRISRLEAAAIFYEMLRAGKTKPVRAGISAVLVWQWTAWLGPALTGAQTNPT